MERPSTEALAARLDRLERENLWLKRIGAVAIFGLLMLVALGTDAVRKPRSIAAESFILKDDQGQCRAALAIGPLGPSLRFLDDKGRDQLALRAGEDGSSAVDLLQTGSVRASFANYVGVGSSVNLYHRTPRGAAAMFMTDDGSSGISFHRDRRGVAMNVASDGTSKLKFTDRTGEEHAAMALSRDGELTTLPGTPASTTTEDAGITEVRPVAPPTEDRPVRAEAVPDHDPTTLLPYGTDDGATFGPP